MVIRNETRSERRQAFTLMEMLVVVAIIVALAGIGGYFLIGALNDAKKDAAILQAKELTKICEGYYVKHSRWPDSLQMLLQKDDHGGPYLTDADKLMDPWGKPYQYDPAGPKNRNLKPDIYTTSPTPGDPPLGNWPRSQQ